ncbi:MOSC domain-containing protein [Dactylonectria estremocensis]|uniref:MOSC domain-containing protein n=1 Tax=Dactylonectria estremocensis TaxID=1079267 RepID=A0A9P9J4R9_9HYPO|nr:MOSC domain-containing protein [Dactylonectria estremocensis]
MRITELWVYPIKAIRGIQLDSAKLGPRGIQHDRRFMLCKVEESGELTKIQMSKYPQCALFAQEIVGDSIHVRYLTPQEPLVPPRPEHGVVLEVPLGPNLEDLERVHVNLHQSLVIAYCMGPKCDAWFTACFGFDTALVFIGDGRRPILGTFAPESQPASKSWLSSLTSYVGGASGISAEEEDWLTFTDCAPYLVTTEQSLKNVSARLASGEVEMGAFRPNVVVDGEAEWDEDFWAELRINETHKLALTKNCNRCTSLNIDYDTGRPAEGERGTVLKKLMLDRRVDNGAPYSPVFGRYAFLIGSPGGNGNDEVSVGDGVDVTARMAQRAVWDWPLKDPAAARYYRRA